MLLLLGNIDSAIVIKGIGIVRISANINRLSLLCRNTLPHFGQCNFRKPDQSDLKIALYLNRELHSEHFLTYTSPLSY